MTRKRFWGAVFIAIGALLLTACGSGNSGISSVQSVSISMPPSAAQVAAAQHCGDYKVETSAVGGAFGAIVDAGTCKIGKTEYRIRTFMSANIRDAWVKGAEGLGVRPKWETNTSVTYTLVGN